jgi:hypothetical protein
VLEQLAAQHASKDFRPWTADDARLAFTHVLKNQHLDQLLFETLPKLLETAVAKDQAATKV